MAVALSFSSVGDGPPLIVLHGLFGSQSNWRRFARTMSAHYCVYTVDLRNHGASPWTSSMRYEEMAEDVHALCRRLKVEQPHLVGHSMGGKTAMTFATQYPGNVGRLVVADIAPVPYNHSHEPMIDSLLALDTQVLNSRTEAQERLAPDIPDLGLRQFLLQNLVKGDRGYRWRINLDTIKASMDELIGYAAPANRFEGPALFVYGERSNYVTRDYEPQIRQIFPSVQFHPLSDAGHWLHAERPDEFVSVVNAFLAEDLPAT